MFSCAFCEISKNIFSYRIPPVAASDDNIDENLLSLSNTPIDQIRKVGRKVGGLTLSIHKKFTYNVLENLRNNKEHVERLSVKIVRRKLNIFIHFSMHYGPSI